MARFGSQSMTGRLERVLVQPPLPRTRSTGASTAGAPPRPAAAAAEHEAFCEILESAGAEVVVLARPGNPDAIYVYDPVLVGTDGAVLLRPGKEGRRGEPLAIASSLAAADVPIAAELAEPAFAEGGDTVWLDERTLLVGSATGRTGAVAALATRFPASR